MERSILFLKMKKLTALKKKKQKTQIERNTEQKINKSCKERKKAKQKENITTPENKRKNLFDHVSTEEEDNQEIEQRNTKKGSERTKRL